MMRNASLVVAAVLLSVLMACSHKGGSQTKVQQPQAPTIAADTESDTVGCMFVAENIHPEPKRLVEEYLRRDAIGEFLSSTTNHWDLGARTCPGHEAAFDAATVVTSYDVAL